jgi:hypothetical protein
MSIWQFGGCDSFRCRDRAGGSLVIDNYNVNQEVGMKVQAKRGSAAAAVVALLLTTSGGIGVPLHSWCCCVQGGVVSLALR